MSKRELKFKLFTSGWSVNDKREREFDLTDYYEPEELEGKSIDEIMAMIDNDTDTLRDIEQAAFEQHSFEWWIEAVPND